MYFDIEEQFLWDRLNSLPRPRVKIKITEDNFSILRLNGIIGGYYTNNDFHRTHCNYFKKDYIKGTFGIDYDSEKTQKTLEKIILYYGYLYKNFNSSLNFAWEKYEKKNEVLQTAKDIANTTDSLVVIGYSFPFFNRRIDKEILSNMGSLKKVYIQSPPKTNNDIVTRFNAMLGDDMKSRIDVIPVTSVDEFYIPHEFD